MFNRLFVFIIPTCIVFSVLISATILLEPSSEKHQFLPTSGGTRALGKEEDESEEQQRRLAWIEQIHKAAPGTDWREMDRKTRWKKYQNSNYLGKSGGAVSIAGGLLEGVWTEKGSGNLAGRTHTADYDTSNGKIYLGSDGGNIWRGSINGSNWEVLNDQLKFESIELVRVIHRNDSKRILVGTSDRFIYYSDDEGETWQSSTGLPLMTAGSERIERVQVCDDSLATVLVLLKGHSTGISSSVQLYKSTDRGATFSLFYAVPNVGNGDLNQFDIWAPEYGNTSPYLVHNDQAYRIGLNDSTLTNIGELPGIPQGYTMLTGYLAPNGNVSLYAYVDQKIFRSTNQGVDWSLMTDIGKFPFFKTSFNASVNTPDLLYFGDIECYRSLNGGSTWTKINDWPDYYQNMTSKLHADIPSVNCLRKADGSEFQLINTDGGTYISTNNVQQVTNISMNGLNISQYYSSLTARYDTNMVFLGAQDQGFQLTETDNGGLLMPEQVVSGDYGHIVTGNEGFSIFMVYPGFAIFYPDATTTSDFTWDFDGNNTFWIPPLLADPDYDDIAYMANGNKITKLQPNGTTLTANNLAPSFMGGISAIAVSPLNHNYWYVYTDSGRFYRSTDRGQTWASIVISNSPNGNYLYGACIYPSKKNLGEVYVCGSGYSNPPVYFSTNNGVSFTATSNGLPSTLVYKMDGTPGDEFIFAATEVGPYVYVKSENTWFDLGEGIAPNQNYWSLDYIESMKTARFVTYGRGAWDFRVQTPLSTPLVTTSQTRVFPNPANDEISIQSEAYKTDAAYALYDVSGKLIKSGKLQQGTTQIPVRDVNSGVYFIVLQDGSKKKVEKLIISH